MGKGHNFERKVRMNEVIAQQRSEGEDDWEKGRVKRAEKDPSQAQKDGALAKKQ